MKSYVFKVKIEKDEDVWHAYCPALPGCVTWGYTHEEALKNIQEAVQCHVEALVKLGKPIPVADPEKVQVISSPVALAVI